MDKREATRDRVLKAGLIEFGGGAINCMARNVANTGAGLDIVSASEEGLRWKSGG
jgi:hypothetical protein